MNQWKLTDEKINDLQVDSINRLITRCKAAHYVNVLVRINGKDEVYEADWLKHLTPALETPVAPFEPLRYGPNGDNAEVRKSKQCLCQNMRINTPMGIPCPDCGRQL